MRRSWLELESVGTTLCETVPLPLVPGMSLMKGRKSLALTYENPLEVFGGIAFVLSWAGDGWCTR